MPRRGRHHINHVPAELQVLHGQFLLLIISRTFHVDEGWLRLGGLHRMRDSLLCILNACLSSCTTAFLSWKRSITRWEERGFWRPDFNQINENHNSTSQTTHQLESAYGIIFVVEKIIISRAVKWTRVRSSSRPFPLEDEAEGWMGVME